ncbi:MAG: hypothetical protein HY331_10745, partial [Chloroflexi bacterium]|nr:hypothetical protein [Chloroflexota bacterium]
MTASRPTSTLTPKRLSRRQMLAAAGVFGMSGGLAVLAGCAPGAPPPAVQPTTPPAAAPQPTSAPAAQPTKAAVAQPTIAPVTRPTIAPAAQATAVPAATTRPAAQGGTLVVAGDGVGDNFVPASGFQGWAHGWVINNIFDNLFISRDMKTITPALAVGSTASADGLVYTFQLRKGVKFHDGTP